MKTVVLGSGGLLGRHCLKVFPGAVGYGRIACDITNFTDVSAAVVGADIVINCAAYTDADRAETNVSKAWGVNAAGAEKVAMACKRAKATLVHISTDSVFDGEKAGPYETGDKCNPISAYGQTKLEGEERARDVGGRVFVVRVQGLYGEGGRNFASRIVPAVKERKYLLLDNERRTQPTWAMYAAQLIHAIVGKGAPGTYHASSGGDTTWGEFADHVMQHPWAGPGVWDASLVTTADLKLPARRPRNCVFSHKSLEGVAVPLDWRESLNQYLRTLR